MNEDIKYFRNLQKLYELNMEDVKSYNPYDREILQERADVARLRAAQLENQEKTYILIKELMKNIKKW